MDHEHPTMNYTSFFLSIRAKLPLGNRAGQGGSKSRRGVILFLSFLLFSPLCAQTINYATFNIRYANGDKNHQQRCWEARRDNVCQFLFDQDLSIIGLQEVLHHQLKDLLTMLPQYDYEGVAREDGKKKGEYAPILWRRREWQRISGGTFWLSEHPDSIASMGWDAACTRIATYVFLENKENGRRLMCINTHLDHVGHKARINSAQLILRKAREIVKEAPVGSTSASQGTNAIHDSARDVTHSIPFILTGDFNVTPTDPVYTTITSDPNFPIMDSFCQGAPHEGVRYTFQSFGSIPPERCGKIDYLFTSPDILTCRTFIPQEDRSTQPRYLSDHNPVVVRLSLPE